MFKNKFLYYIPILYSFKRGGISLQILYGPFLVLVFLILSKSIILSLNTFYIIIFNYLLFKITYEIGYLINDGVSVKTEKTPTIRSDIFKTSYALKLILVRILSIILIYILMYFLLDKNIFNYYLNTFTVFIFLILVVYIFHNFIHFIDIKLRIISHFSLHLLRWIALLHFFLISIDPKYVIITFLYFVSIQIMYTYTYIFDHKKFFKNCLRNIRIFSLKELEKNTGILTLLVFILSGYFWKKEGIFFVFFIQVCLFFLLFLRVKVKPFLLTFYDKLK